jgi:hypothetical protein
MELIFLMFLLNMMSRRKTRHTTRGFLNAASMIVPSACSLFQESSSQSRHEALLRHARPELHGRPIVSAINPD